MIGPYLENHEMMQFNKTLEEHVISSTLSCWVATRINGGSASMSCDGNVSIPLMKIFDDIKERVTDSIKNPKLTPHEAGMLRLKTEPEPEGQKFKVGSRVRIADDLGESMSHFSSGVDATVDHTYAHAYGGSDVKSYALDIDGKGFSAWYKENQLTQI